MKPTMMGAVLVVLSSVGWGCEQGTQLETRTFDLEYLEPEIAKDIIQPYLFERSESPGMIQISQETGTITVREQADNLEQIARVLEERDKPLPGVSLHFRIVEAVPEQTSRDSLLVDVEPSLREVFRFGGYRLVGESVVRASDRTDFSQRIASPVAHSITGTLQEVQQRRDGQLNARLSVKFWPDDRTVALETTVNLVDGRTIVLGTAGGRAENGALILVVRPVFDKD